MKGNPKYFFYFGGGDINISLFIMIFGMMLRQRILSFFDGNLEFSKKKFRVNCWEFGNSDHIWQVGPSKRSEFTPKITQTTAELIKQSGSQSCIHSNHMFQR